ncbi:MAG: UDP-N-acetylmuramoyl-L-alanyl-D-glutamate--2,6-diaminopimelate ligase [Verrucomicrobiota bacterium]
MMPMEYMPIQEVMNGIPVRSWNGERKAQVRRVTYDSRQLEAGDLFCTWAGQQSDGMQYVADAEKRGASAIVVERVPETLPDCDCIVVGSGRRTLALAAANRYGKPAEAISVTGITGTNGKSSTATLLHYLLEASGRKCGLIGTVEYRLGNRVEVATRTTPEGSDLQEMLAEIRDANCVSAVMEVSSHALHQGRVEGLPFRGAIFTNISQDHLDYHKDMESYFMSKSQLFRQIAPEGYAVLPAEGDAGRRLKEMIADDVSIFTYGIEVAGDSVARDVKYFRNGTSFIWQIDGQQHEVIIPWIGAFNLENALAALTAAVASGVELSLLVELIERAPGVPGRMQRVGEDELFTILVDYAHTEDALKNVLEALQPLRETSLKTLIGCGGNRDKGKRPFMARVACELSDEVVFTSDNPRDEEPAAILADMVAGVEAHENYRVIEDRHDAITELVENAVRGDILLIAGKGHEDYQEIQGLKHAFSDADVVRELLKGRRG